MFAGALARRTGASVHVLHVYDRLVGGNGVMLRSRDNAKDLVTRAVHELADSGVRASGSVRASTYRRGVPGLIVAEARRRSVDAIVLGSNRRRRLSRPFSSRVRERTTRLTSLPVLTAPAPLQVTSTARSANGDRRFEDVLDSLFR